VEALNIAIENNGTILQAQKEVEAVAGIAIQTRAILLPKVTNSARYSLLEDSLIEGNQSVSSKTFGAGTNNQAWSGDIQVVQSIYEGGRMRSAARSSKLIQEQALLVFQSTVSDALLSVSTAYDDVLSTSKQIEVRRASVTLLKEY